jgi:hypothetical protein
MSTSTNAVVSGVSCPVSTVAGTDPVLLAQFLGETEFTVESAGEQHRVSGFGSTLDARVVRFHEKDAVLGKDVRVWHITRSGSGFAAEHIAAF